MLQPMQPSSAPLPPPPQPPQPSSTPSQVWCNARPPQLILDFKNDHKSYETAREQWYAKERGKALPAESKARSAAWDSALQVYREKRTVRGAADVVLSGKSV